MRKLLILLIGFCAIFHLSIAQDFPQNPNQTDPTGKRQGKWTILYDADFELVNDTNQATFYRIVTYQAGRPMGRVVDYYRNGQAQMVADSIFNQEPESYHGEVTYYREDGSKETVFLFDEGLLKQETSFHPDGRVAEEKQYPYFLGKNKEEEGWQNLMEKGVAAYQAADYAQALELIKQAKIQAKKEFGTQHENTATTYFVLGALYRVQGDYSHALNEHQKALKIRLKLFEKNHPEVAQSHNNLGIVYARQGNYRRAIEEHQEALEIRRALYGENHLEVAESYGNLGLVYDAQGDYPRALKTYQQALKIRTATLDKNDFRIALGHNNLGVVYVNLGNYAKALEEHQKALNIRLVAYNQDHPEVADSYHNLGTVYSYQGKHDRSLQEYQKALDIFLATYGEMHPDVAQTLINMGLAYHRLDKPKQALEFYKKALEIKLAIYPENHPQIASAYGHLGSVYYYQSDYDQALANHQKALDIRSRIFDENHPELGESYYGIGTIHSYQKNYSKAYQFYQKAFRNQLFQINQNFRVLSEREKALFFKKLSTNFEVYADFLSKAYSEIPELTSWIYNLRLATKGILFQSSQKVRRRIIGSGDSLLIAKFQEWQYWREQLANAYTLTNEEKQQKGIDQSGLENTVNKIEQELSKVSQIFAQNSDTTRYTWRDIQQQLQPKEAAVEIIRVAHYEKTRTDSILYLALIIRPETQEQPELVILPHGNELEGKYLYSYLNRIQAQTTDQMSYQHYWQAIAQKLGGIEKIYLSGDGVYHQISLNTLQNPLTKKYLLEEVQIQRISSTKDLVTNPVLPSSSPSALLMGRPTYDLEVVKHQKVIQTYQSQRSTEASGFNAVQEIAETKLADLPNTEVEVLQIHQQLQAQSWLLDTYLQENALEEVLKRARSPRLLHIATHGFFFENSDQRLPEKTALNPMLRSGLLLAGVRTYAQKREAYEQEVEDGLLTAYEAAHLNLDSTELVVLSACETGKGKLQHGEGVYGLQRGFQQAGAQSVLMSLWKVDDEATQKLMNSFYQHWIGEGRSKREAFQTAQLEMKAEYKYPYYWGAFVMVGHE